MKAQSHVNLDSQAGRGRLWYEKFGEHGVHAALHILMDSIIGLHNHTLHDFLRSSYTMRCDAPHKYRWTHTHSLVRSIIDKPLPAQSLTISSPLWSHLFNLSHWQTVSSLTRKHNMMLLLFLLDATVAMWEPFALSTPLCSASLYYISRIWQGVRGRGREK